MRLILDAGAFVAIERGDRDLLARLMREQLAGQDPVTHGGIIGQVWRGGRGRQVLLARALSLVRVVPLDSVLGRRAGELLALAGGRDVIDAALVLLSVNGDRVLTSDPDDLRHLAATARRRIEVVTI